MLAPDGSRRELTLESFWAHLGNYILKFQDIDSISAAETLVGCELQVPQEERAALEPGAAYVSDLVGCSVWVPDAGWQRELGAITEVQFGAGEAPLLVIRSGTAEYLVPFAAEYLHEVDLPQRRLEMRLPAGMLELDAPLSDEEKRQQSGGRDTKQE